MHFLKNRFLIFGLCLYLYVLSVWQFHAQKPPLIIDNDLFLAPNAAALASDSDTAVQLEVLLQEPVNISDFASMADRIVKFAVLAEATVTEELD